MRLLLQYRLLSEQIRSAAVSLETMQFSDFDKQAFAAGDTFRDIFKTLNDNKGKVGLSAFFEIAKLEENLEKTLLSFDKLLRFGSKLMLDGM